MIVLAVTGRGLQFEGLGVLGLESRSWTPALHMQARAGGESQR